MSSQNDKPDSVEIPVTEVPTTQVKALEMPAPRAPDEGIPPVMSDPVGLFEMPTRESSAIEVVAGLAAVVNPELVTAIVQAQISKENAAAEFTSAKAKETVALAAKITQEAREKELQNNLLEAGMPDHKKATWLSVLGIRYFGVALILIGVAIGIREFIVQGFNAKTLVSAWPAGACSLLGAVFILGEKLVQVLLTSSLLGSILSRK